MKHLLYPVSGEKGGGETVLQLGLRTVRLLGNQRKLWTSPLAHPHIQCLSTGLYTISEAS